MLGKNRNDESLPCLIRAHFYSKDTEVYKTSDQKYTQCTVARGESDSMWESQERLLGGDLILKGV